MMFKPSKITRRAQLLASCAAAGMMLAGAAAGQDASDEDEKEIEEVVVTGSRIVRKDLTSAAPLTIVSSLEFQESGEVDIVELLRENPALNSSLTATQSALTGAPNGVGQLNLRGLGTDRTLVLVNGRRHVSGVAGTASVDTQSIPVALIDRVETVTGAGSSVYGSDAVSGVVNFILKEDFEGIDYRGQFGITDRGDGQTYFGSLTMGSNFDGDRGNAVLSIEYSKSEAILEADRPYAGAGFDTAIPNTAFFSGQALPSTNFNNRSDSAINIFVPNVTLPISSAFGVISVQPAPSFGSFSAVAFYEFFQNNPSFTIPGIPVAQVVDETGTLRPFEFGIPADAFNASGGDGIAVRSPFSVLTPDIEKISVNANSRYEITDNITAFLETKFVFTASLDNGAVNGFNDDIPIALDNPFIPTALRAQLDQAIAAGFTPDITISRDTLDLTTQPGLQSDRYTFRAVGGFKGDFDNGISYEMSFNYGRTEVANTSLNTRLEDRFFAGIDAVVDPDTGAIVCRSDLDPTAIPPVSPFPSTPEGFRTFLPGDGQCVPINIFGPNAISQEAADFAFVDTNNTAELEQKVIMAFVTGDSSNWFELPAGPIGWAAGFEYREEDSEFTVDPLDSAGVTFNTSNNPPQSEFGGFSVTEFFAEVAVPLLADLPLIQSLDLDASVRVADYSTAGAVEAYGATLKWQIIDDVLLRGAYNRSVRGPNVTELFSPLQPATLSLNADPCNEANLLEGSEFRVDNCLALVGPNFNASNFASAFRPGIAGGNPNLVPETSDTFSIGVTLRPSFAPGLNITVDYYSIEISDAIATIGGATLAEQCVDAPTLDNAFCDAIDRNPETGVIDFFRTGAQNVAALKTEGLDIAADYSWDIAEAFGLDNDYGIASHSFGALYLISREDFPFQNSPDQPDNLKGEITFPEFIANYTFRWDYAEYGFTWRVNYQSSQYSPGVDSEAVDNLLQSIADGDTPEGTLLFDPLKTGDAFQHDVTVSYNYSENIQLRAGVNNLLDRNPFVGTLTRPFSPVGRNFFFAVSGRF